MTPVRYAIAGVGGFGATRRGKLRETGQFHCVGGTDPDASVWPKAESEEGHPLQRYDSVDQLAADDGIDAVFISTPAHLHVEQAMIAARAGKAIFTEKPLGHDLAACRELVTYCETNGIPHGHGFGARFQPIHCIVKNLLDDHTLGTIVSVSVATMHTGGLAFSNNNWRFTRDRNPGGPLFQCGIHDIDLCRYLFGDGSWLAGTVQRGVTDSETDDAYVLLGAFGGVPVTLHSHYVASYRHTMEIYGTKGDLFIEHTPPRLRHKRTDLTSGFEPTIDLTDQIRLTASTEPDSLRDFAAAVRERRQPLMSGREGLTSLELVFAAAQVATPASREPDT